MHQGLPCVIESQALLHKYQNKSSSQHVGLHVVVQLFLLQLLLLHRFLYISYIYNHECSCNAYENAKIIKVHYLRF
jgi:hypothetical protein